MALNPKVKFPHEVNGKAHIRITKAKVFGSKLPQREALGEIGNQGGNGPCFLPQKNIKQGTLLEGKKHKTASEINQIAENTKIISKLTISSKCSKLPQLVEDADNDDEGNLFLVSIYVNDIYNYLRKLEDKFPIMDMFLIGQDITGKMRAVLVDWLVEVQIQFKLVQETLQRAVAIIDLYLQVVKNISKGHFQLLGITAVLIASKYEEIYPPELSDLIFITDNAYTKKEMIDMECNILKTLSFDLGRPVSISFLRRYSKVSKAQPLQHAYAKYFIDLALVEYSLSHVKPSMVAAGATFIAQCVVRNVTKASILPQIWGKTLQHYSSYSYADLENVVPGLVELIKKAPSWKLQAVREKYSSNKQFRVSLQSDISPNSEVIKLLSNLNRENWRN